MLPQPPLSSTVQFTDLDTLQNSQHLLHAEPHPKNESRAICFLSVIVSLSLSLSLLLLSLFSPPFPSWGVTGRPQTPSDVDTGAAVKVLSSRHEWLLEALAAETRMVLHPLEEVGYYYY